MWRPAIPHTHRHRHGSLWSRGGKQTTGDSSTARFSGGGEQESRTSRDKKAEKAADNRAHHLITDSIIPSQPGRCQRFHSGVSSLGFCSLHSHCDSVFQQSDQLSGTVAAECRRSNMLQVFLCGCKFSNLHFPDKMESCRHKGFFGDYRGMGA